MGSIMFDRFTETARRVIREAHEEAQRCQHRSVNAEHLFWAMLRQRDGIALAVLDRLGLQRSALIEDVEGVLARMGTRRYSPGQKVYSMTDAPLPTPCSASSAFCASSCRRAGARRRPAHVASDHLVHQEEVEP